MSHMRSGRMVLSAVMALGAVTLTACEKAKSKRPVYDGVPFSIKTKAVDKKVSRADFVVEVKDAALSLTGARLAGYHAGVTYCLSEAGYGSSDIVWDIDPTDPEAQLQLVEGTAVFHGTCDP